jgi:cellulose 1,4-beta-cellobiosidase
MYSKIALASILLKAAYGQQIGTLAAETHPALTWEKCTAAGSCTAVEGKVTMDANWRWVHSSASGR